ncbi:BUD13 [Biomphalaria pfeifferi]|uniref:BUD13 homolog n=1 Tax=Biomphalaria pfeifferi TaxID=112525 RepID=A0AAD8EU97_BIOPF|nr:BUD13 [Biomphalaria pfeifferi]
MAAVGNVSKAEYLKRYLSNEDLPKEERKKKRKKIKQTKDSKIKIIDDDVDLKQLQAERGGLEDLDEGPVVAEVIDERPKHIQQLEQFRKNDRWKLLGNENEDFNRQDSVIGKGKFETDNPSIKHKPHSTNRHLDNKKSSSGSPPKMSKIRNDSSSDTSPPRNNNSRHDSDSNSSPPRKNRVRHDSDSDQSPPRIDIASRGSDQTSFRKAIARHDSNSDQSPPRKDTVNHILSLNHSASKHSPGSDESPPRKNAAKVRHDSDSDQSPPRKNPLKVRHDSDQSPPRKSKQRHSSKSPSLKRMPSPNSDQSPPRKRKSKFESAKSPKRRRDKSSTPDQSPPRKSSQKDGSKGNADRPESSSVKAQKTLSGAKAGLSSAREMMEEAKTLRDRTDKAFQNMDEKLLGRNAATVVRDRETGRRKNTEEERAKNEEEEKRKEELKNKYEVWGKGIKQQQNRSAVLEDQVYEASKPLARYKDDKDLDKMCREEERDEDPMLAYIRNRKKKEEQKSGKKKTKEIPKYKGPQPPPNRFSIMPGYRWDGVDRSNGFEKKIYQHAANKKATQEIAYKWSTEDM